MYLKVEFWIGQYRKTPRKHLKIVSIWEKWYIFAV